MPARCCAPASASPLPEPMRGRQPQSPQRAVRHLAERAARDQPARLQPRADDRRPVSADRPGQADDDGGADCRQSPGIRPRLRERNGLRRAVAPRNRAAAPSVLLEVEYVGSGQNTSPSATTRTKCSLDRGRRTRAGCCSRSRRSTTCCSAIRAIARPTTPEPCGCSSSEGMQFLVSYTYGKSLDYGGSAASGGGAVGNGQTITNMDVARTVRLRRAPSHVHQLRVRVAVRQRPALDEQCGKCPSGPRRRMAAGGASRR